MKGASHVVMVRPGRHAQGSPQPGPARLPGPV